MEDNLTRSQRHLERYLHLATWGLWGRHKREVRQELEGNIREMALENEITGLKPHEALEQALRAFGKPELVNAGMTRVYTMPILMRNTLLAAALGILSIGTINSSTAQVLTSDRAPVEACQNPTATEFKVGENTYPCDNFLSIRMDSLRAVLEPLGVKFTSPLGSPKDSSTLYMTFPGGREVTLRGLDASNFSFSPASNIRESVKLIPGFLSIQEFFDALSLSRLPVVLEGWDMAVIRVGAIDFTLGTPTNPVENSAVFLNALYSPLASFFPPRLLSKSPMRADADDLLLAYTMPRQPDAEAFYRYRVRIKNLQSDSVYVVLSREGSTTVYYGTGSASRAKKIDTHRSAHIGPFKDGLFEFPSSASRLEASDSTSDLEQIKYNTPGKVVVARFTGRLDQGAKSFEIVPTDQVIIERVR